MLYFFLFIISAALWQNQQNECAHSEDWADAQAHLSLRQAHTHFVGFVMSRLILKWSANMAAILKTAFEWSLRKDSITIMEIWYNFVIMFEKVIWFWQ